MIIKNIKIFVYLCKDNLLEGTGDDVLGGQNSWGWHHLDPNA